MLLYRKDTDEERALHLLAFNVGYLFNRNGELIFQMQIRPGEAINFDLIMKHEVILKEVESVFAVFMNERENRKSIK